MADLNKGIFWIKPNDERVIFKARCDINGVFCGPIRFELLSKNGDEFNHRMAWRELSKSETDGKAYNYYPRGRITIRRGKAVIYANQNIANEELKSWAIKEFGLTSENGIVEVVLKVDMSNHYLCQLDRL